MIALSSGLKVVVAAQPVDFRKGVHGLIALVASALKDDPYCGSVFIFRSKRMDRLKLLVWDGTGIILATKWLEDGRFFWPPVRDGAIQLSAAQFALLIDGLDWTKAAARTVRRPSRVG